jgi:hypothetical protein
MSERDGWQCAQHCGRALFLKTQRDCEQPTHRGIQTVVCAE